MYFVVRGERKFLVVLHFSQKLRYFIFSKLHVINFPMDMSLLTGLAKAVYEEVPPQYRHPISEETWEDWVVSWRKKHAIFDE